MKGLLIKDFYQQKKNLGIMLLIFIFFRVLLVLFNKYYQNTNADSSGSSIILGVLIIMQELMKNDYDMAYTLAMPISKKTYVNEKLLFAFLLIVLIIIADIFSFFIIKIITGVNMLNMDFFYNSLFFAILGFLMANLGLYLNNYAGMASFILAVILVIPLVIMVISFFYMIDTSYLKYRKVLLFLLFLLYVLINEIIRRATVRKIKEKRY
ncbi:MAG: ABC-2 transporter permease [Peptoniphilaceae bacterium]|nr:ABC-2 transporter permease [Peptoniphilaceae bacterium]MDY6019556.1 ABC-2 transporter permease [Anaerococcus sp.]